MSSQLPPPPGWYPPPGQPGLLAYWDGLQWTGDTVVAVSNTAPVLHVGEYRAADGRIMEMHSDGLISVADPEGRHSYWVALVLSLLLGGFGVDRFYLGKVGSGVAKLLTAGGLGLWTLGDLIAVIAGGARDAEGYRLRDYRAGCRIGLPIFGTLWTLSTLTFATTVVATAINVVPVVQYYAAGGGSGPTGGSGVGAAPPVVIVASGPGGDAGADAAQPTATPTPVATDDGGDSDGGWQWPAVMPAAPSLPPVTVRCVSARDSAPASAGTSSDPRAARFALGSRAAVEGIGESSATVGNGGSVLLRFSYAGRYYGDTAPTPRVTLERRLPRGEWRTVGSKPEVSEGLVRVFTPSYCSRGARTTAEYRLVSRRHDGAGHGVGNYSVSGTARITYENQQRYTGMASTIYRYAAAYCPNTAVHITSLDAEGDSVAGDYQPGALLIRISPKVGTEANLDLASQRALALHECGHERQWLNYGGTSDGFDTMEETAATIFANSDGIPPIEHGADCGAIALEPNGYLGYGGSCSIAQQAAGRRLLEGRPY